jgi:hypothetical protein
MQTRKLESQKNKKVEERNWLAHLVGEVTPRGVKWFWQPSISSGLLQGNFTAWWGNFQTLLPGACRPNLQSHRVPNYSDKPTEQGSPEGQAVSLKTNNQDPANEERSHPTNPSQRLEGQLLANRPAMCNGLGQNGQSSH